MMQPLRFGKPNRQSAWASMWVRKTLTERFVIRNHRRLLLDGTLMVQVLLMMSILRHILLSSVNGRSIEKKYRRPQSHLTPQYLVPAALVAFLIGIFNSFGGLTSIGISWAWKLLVLEIAPIDFQKALSLPDFGCSIWCNPSFLSFFWLVFVASSLGHPCHVADLGRNHYSDTHSRLCQKFSKILLAPIGPISRVDDPSSRNAVLQSIFLIVFLFDVSLDHCQLHFGYHSRQHPAGLWSFIVSSCSSRSRDQSAIYRKKIRTLWDRNKREWDEIGHSLEFDFVVLFLHSWWGL